MRSYAERGSASDISESYSVPSTVLDIFTQFPSSSVLIGGTSGAFVEDFSSTEEMDIPKATEGETVMMDTEKETDASVPHIVWVIDSVGQGIPQAHQQTIQDFIIEKGINCQIDFIYLGLDDGEEYKAWLAEQRDDGKNVDIFSPCSWEYGIMKAVPFTEEEFYPMNDFLESEEGKKLWESFSEIEWRLQSVNGINYAVPNRQGLKDYGIYLYFNDLYLEYCEEGFDGTYDTLKRVYDRIQGPKPTIYTRGYTDSQLMAFFGGYENGFLLTYDYHTQKVCDLINRQELKKFLHDIYMDYKSGVLVDCYDAGEPDDYSESTLAFLTYERIEPPKGFSVYTLKPDLMVTQSLGTYGILSSSKQKTLAFQVLATCYSDPKIASLIQWKTTDTESWIEYKKYMDLLETSALTGFVPRLPEEEMPAYKQYYEELLRLCIEMYVTTNKGVSLNPNYLNYLDRFFARPRDYGDLFDTINAQLEEWFSTKE